MIEPYYSRDGIEIYCGDALKVLKAFPDELVNCCVTSPPYYGLRDYGIVEQIGLEKTPEDYVEKLVNLFREVRRTLRDDGTLWLNLGDSYAGSGGMGSWVDSKAKKGMKIIKDYHRNKPIKGLKPKDLVGIPWRVAFALQADGWWLRQDIIWNKPNPMPESVQDRCTKSHEYIFLLSKNAKYYYDQEAIMEVATGYDGRKDIMMKGSKKYSSNGFAPTHSKQTLATKSHVRWKRKNDGTKHGGNGSGFQDHSGYSNLENPFIRNKRSVWTVNTRPYSKAHFAVFPPELIIPCIKAGSRKDDIVLDPFGGSGTVADVAHRLGRKAISIELNPEYCDLHLKRWTNYELGL